MLAGLRLRYDLVPGVIRVDGHSGGPMPRTSPARLRRFVQHRWEPRSGRASGESDWRREARLAAGALAPLVGATAGELTVAESTSINLFKALVAAAKLRPGRPVLAVGRDCFATDRCLAQSAADHIGGRLQLIDGVEGLAALPVEEVAVVALSNVDLRSGAVRDAEPITAEIHRGGALTLWDLSHSAGALDVDLHRWNADFAIGCGHKYLGGSTTAPSFGFVAERHLEPSPTGGLRHPLAEGFAGPAATLAATELRDVLAILDGVPVSALEAKTTGLVELFLERIGEFCPEAAVEVRGSGSQRRAQVCIRHDQAQRIADLLSDRSVLVEYAEPDLLRFNFAPAWLSYVDVWQAAERLHATLHEIGMSDFSEHGDLR
ncbi:aminotransferase class V-fold PLP-dependent enzyme [Saccharopolyspora mangrovi]|uniref:Aminotransferase class V-fold PLP-dependent enzyme n=1 Tax=Saccharopolyspora mangrovi TaxID=3082379 RepID=A0ABU6ADQ1_9PSEU|nr:aminotransferase class V-fold PLP-dependent enzyme [Saccharopolyspora sp. S2-29]MEB3369586.1 aminotransferase class V-fold PLP-dependent enzyme [Saccharopolyspora sp. S2-29]